MRSETNQQTVAARNTKASERISRVLSSSRCSRKDIWPPSSSALSFPVPSALKNVDINFCFVQLTHNQSCLGEGFTSSVTPSESAPPEAEMILSSEEASPIAVAWRAITSVGVTAAIVGGGKGRTPFSFCNIELLSDSVA